MGHPDKLPPDRLLRLQSYLQEDPSNVALLAELCDLALEEGWQDCARECVATAVRLQLASPEWTGRAIHLTLESARQQLAAGDATRSREELAPLLVRAGLEPSLQAAIQVLWLRATHACVLPAEALAWARSRQEVGELQPEAAGVASLAAIDTGDLPAAKQLAEASFKHGAALPEALVARASVALAERDSVGAMQLLRQAHSTNPEDGRTLSALAMTHLQAGEFEAARERFTAALARMPAHIGSWHGLGWVCLLQGDPSGAHHAFRRALDLDRSFAESQGAVGLSLLLAGRADEAQHHLDLADRLDRHNVTARYARALQAGELRDAAAVQRLALRLLDRPGLFGGHMHEELAGQLDRGLRRGG